jgi:hypothetical protein
MIYIGVKLVKRKNISLLKRISSGVISLVIGFLVLGILMPYLPKKLMEAGEASDNQNSTAEGVATINYNEVLSELGFKEYSGMYIWEHGNESLIFNSWDGADGLVYETFSWTDNTIWSYYPNKKKGYIDHPDLENVCEYDLDKNEYISQQTCSDYDLEVLTYTDDGLNGILNDFGYSFEEFNYLIQNVIENN